jgi:hypothetical protein
MLHAPRPTLPNAGKHIAFRNNILFLQADIKHCTMIKNRFSRCLLAFCLLLLTSSVNSFASDPWPKKSTFGSVEFTRFAGFHTASLNYEVMWHKDKLHHGFSGGLMAVFWDEFGWSRFGPSARYTMLTGKSKNHLELNAGVSYYPVKLYGEDRAADGESSSFAPFGQIGYRYQKPEGKAYFRIFAGFPLTGIGAGFRLGSNQ